MDPGTHQVDATNLELRAREVILPTASCPRLRDKMGKEMDARDHGAPLVLVEVPPEEVDVVDIVAVRHVVEVAALTLP